VPVHIVSDDLMDSAYSINVNELFTKGSHYRNFILVLTTQNVFHQGLRSRNISLNSKTQIVLLAR